MMAIGQGETASEAVAAGINDWIHAMCLGIPGRVVSRFEVHGQPMGKVDFGGVVKSVCLAYVPEIEVGQHALVHVGFAIAVVDEQSARESLELFRQMGLLDGELGPEGAS